MQNDPPDRDPEPYDATIRLILYILYVFVGFIVVAGLAANNASLFFGSLERGDVVQLFSGAATAAAVVALWLSLKQVEDTRQAGRKAAALEANQLSASFYSQEYRAARDEAYAFLRWIETRNSERIEIAKIWVFDEPWNASNDLLAYLSEAPPVGSPEEETRFLPIVERQKRLLWALSNMIDFFVRLHTHIESSLASGTMARRDIKLLLARFFFDYWRPHLVRHTRLCRSLLAASTSSHRFPSYASTVFEKLNEWSELGEKGLEDPALARTASASKLGE